jgi:hypothetical protein
MLFRKLRRSSSDPPKKAPSTGHVRHNSTSGEKASKTKKSTVSRAATGESDDYEVFLLSAKKEAERKEEEKLRLAREFERRREQFNMDPWSSKW